MADEQNPFRSPQARDQLGTESLSSDELRKPTRKEWFSAFSTAVYISALLLPLFWFVGFSFLKPVIRLMPLSDSVVLDEVIRVGLWSVLLVPSVVIGRLIFKSKIASGMKSKIESESD